MNLIKKIKAKRIEHQKLTSMAICHFCGKWIDKISDPEGMKIEWDFIGTFAYTWNAETSLHPTGRFTLCEKCGKNFGSVVNTIREFRENGNEEHPEHPKQWYLEKILNTIKNNFGIDWDESREE